MHSQRKVKRQIARKKGNIAVRPWLRRVGCIVIETWKRALLSRVPLERLQSCLERECNVLFVYEVRVLVSTFLIRAVTVLESFVLSLLLLVCYVMHELAKSISDVAVVFFFIKGRMKTRKCQEGRHQDVELNQGNTYINCVVYTR